MSGGSALSQVLSAIWFVLPAYFANGGALLLGGGKPLDLGRRLHDGRRILGDGVTIRGTIGGILVGSIVGILQGLVAGQPFRLLAVGTAMGFGAMSGDMTGSFIKRRLNMSRGQPAPGLDQVGFLVFALAFAAVVVRVKVETVVILLIVTPVIHLSTNATAYLLGLKKVWY